MDASGILYIGATAGMFAIFAIIVYRVYRKGAKDEGERAKYKMMEDD